MSDGGIPFLHQAIVVSGHMIDHPDRSSPLFPRSRGRRHEGDRRDLRRVGRRARHAARVRRGSRGRTSPPAGARAGAEGLAPRASSEEEFIPSSVRLPGPTGTPCAACRLRRTVPADELGPRRRPGSGLRAQQRLAVGGRPVRGIATPRPCGLGPRRATAPAGRRTSSSAPRHGSHGRHRRSRRRTPRHGPVTQAREYRAGSGQGRSGHQAAAPVVRRNPLSPGSWSSRRSIRSVMARPSRPEKRWPAASATSWRGRSVEPTGPHHRRRAVRVSQRARASSRRRRSAWRA